MTPATGSANGGRASRGEGIWRRHGARGPAEYDGRLPFEAEYHAVRVPTRKPDTSRIDRSYCLFGGGAGSDGDFETGSGASRR